VTLGGNSFVASAGTRPGVRVRGDLGAAEKRVTSYEGLVLAALWLGHSRHLSGDRFADDREFVC
jgi:hypothetical protein